MSSDNYSAILERLAIQANEVPTFILPAGYLLGVTTPKPKKQRRPHLREAEIDEILANYWSRRPESAHGRERFVAAAMDWVVYAFLHENANHGCGRNHEIRADSDFHTLIHLLDDSSDRMIRDITCTVEMRSVCWWDVQEHYHNFRTRDINHIADELMDPLIHESVEHLKASGFLSWHSGVWNLSAEKSRRFIQRLKRKRKVFLAPEPSKLSGIYAA